MSAQRILASGGVALLVLIVLAIAFHSDGSSTKVSTPTIPTVSSGVLRAHVAAGQLTLDGGVKDADEHTAITAAANDRFGKDNVLDRLKVQAGADSAAWLATAIPALPRKDAGFGPIDVTATKTALTVSGRVPTAATGNALVKAVGDAAGRKVTSKLRVVGEGAGGTLQANIEPLKAAGSARVVVGGYTDSVGDAKANLNLSKARAHSVVVWLTGHGVPKKTLIAKGYGEDKPIAPNTTAAGRTKNRRIEFTVLSG
jgi:hypothetical protein